MTSILQPDVAHRDSASDRKAAILRAATDSFGQRGVKASSLRDIAADAGVSLTLLDHHFGSKAMLLEAVVEAHHVICRPALEPMRTLLAAPSSSLRLDAFVSAWIAYEFSLYDTPATAYYLRLLIRLHADPDVDNAMRARLHCERPLVIQGLHRIRPGIAEGRLQAAWLLASSAAHAAILHARELDEDGIAAPDDDAARATGCFVFAGLLAYLNVSG